MTEQRQYFRSTHTTRNRKTEIVWCTANGFVTMITVYTFSDGRKEFDMSQRIFHPNQKRTLEHMYVSDEAEFRAVYEDMVKAYPVTIKNLRGNA